MDSGKTFSLLHIPQYFLNYAPSKMYRKTAKNLPASSTEKDFTEI
jgi:hypothetical protein